MGEFGASSNSSEGEPKRRIPPDVEERMTQFKAMYQKLNANARDARPDLAFNETLKERMIELGEQLREELLELLSYPKKDFAEYERHMIDSAQVDVADFLELQAGTSWLEQAKRSGDRGLGGQSWN